MGRPDWDGPRIVWLGPDGRGGRGRGGEGTWVFLYFYCISSDFSDLPDMTDEYIDVSVYALTGLLLNILHLTYIQK